MNYPTSSQVQKMLEAMKASAGGNPSIIGTFFDLRNKERRRIDKIRKFDNSASPLGDKDSSKPYDSCTKIMRSGLHAALVKRSQNVLEVLIRVAKTLK